MSFRDQEDFYSILGVHRTADQTEIRQAYRKAALLHHPDKVPEQEREDAEIRFKLIREAYDILSDDNLRHNYDLHGTEKFSNRSHEDGRDFYDFNDIFEESFFPGFGDTRSSYTTQNRRMSDIEQILKVSLKSLYKGKTEKMRIKRNIICSICEGSGKKSSATTRQCSKCKGSGVVKTLRPIGNGMAINSASPCPVCSGRGEIIRDRDRCKKCLGNRTVKEEKIFELYIQPGSKEGDKIVLQGATDEEPGKKAGNIVFKIQEELHPVFTRRGTDLKASIKISLAEALCGFNRPIIKHIDERILCFNVKSGRVIRPNDVLVVEGEGMPKKGRKGKGNLYLNVDIEFPRDNWFLERADLRIVSESLSSSAVYNEYTKLKTTNNNKDVEDEVDFRIQKSEYGFGANDQENNDVHSKSEEAEGGCTHQ
ncbi:uncharacterized protein V1516DRAFT_682383 [Lipomyces oligophaga]|uniref:uncharacterized protein n=1 Tax=Lipomyces oligophaga TaxID=45792 RepID=UPI0034CF8D87